MGQSSDANRAPWYVRWARQRALLTWAVMIGMGMPLVALVGPDHHVNIWEVAWFVVIGGITAMALLGIGLRLAGFDADAAQIAAGLVPHDDQRRLLERWLVRARWARFVGGGAGVLVWFLGTNAHGDLVLLGTAGIAIGAMVTEGHHVRRRSGPRTARLEVRTLDDYLLHDDARWMLAVALAGVGTAAVGAVRHDTRVACWWGAAALAVILLARVTQQRVANRPRPAIPESLVEADDLARGLAISRGLAQPAIYVGLALVAHGCRALRPELGGLATLAGGAATLCALVRWWGNRRLGLDFLVDTDRSPAPA